jgi:universal stress protein E
MENYKEILVIIDPNTNDQKALKRAIELSNISGAKLTAFLSIFDFSYEMTTMLSADEREIMRKTVITDRLQWVNEIIEEHNPKALNIATKVVWHNRPFEAIINEVLQYDYDMVIKGTHQHDKFKSVIFTPTDWHLLRKCPCPLLLVKEHQWPVNGNILAAINVASDETEHQSLNNKIAVQAKRFAGMMKAHAYLVNSFPGTPVNIAIEIPEFDSNEYNASMLKHHQQAMDKFAERYDITADKTIVEEGLPEDVISDTANKLDAELVILGTIGRTGISAALIGNTAEHVIDRLNCDVLAIKPEGYESPLQKK